MREEVIQLEHGAGGRLTAEFVRDEMLSRFSIAAADGLPDAAELPAMTPPLFFTTDAFVVQPPVFPGGDIGSLAVHGTVNDLAVRGARARALALSLILEEGLSLSLLRAVLDSVREAAQAVGARVLTGDTKVVRRGQCDGLYLVTTGVGEALAGFRPDRRRIAAGDAVLVSGPIGDHGMAVIAARERLPVSDSLRSDSAPVLGLVEALAPVAESVKFMRDPTRGGVAAALNEMAEGLPVGALIREGDLPFSPAARALAETMGIELIRVACEGRIVAVVDAEAAEAALEAWRAHPGGREARGIGEITAAYPGRVVMETRAGGRRIVDWPRGEPLPRIC